MQNISWINASGNQISSISGIEKLTGLQHLYLSENQLSDISSLSQCVQLLDLSISRNSITDISSLNVLNTLMYLDFSYNQIRKIPQWDKSCALVTIDGSHNLISTLDPLSGLSKLNNVYMDFNTEISSVQPLTNCYLLIRVHVEGTKVSDVSALKEQSVIVKYDPTQ